jgi:nucleoid DNA-binding protein
MIREEYLEAIHQETGISKKDIDLVVKTFWKILKLKLKKQGRVNIVNFGTFTVRTTKPHILFSPVDGRSIKTSGIKRIYFSSSKNLLRIISGAEHGND